jgi:DNA mismatch repair protein MutL
LKLALVNTGFVFEDTSENHVVISGTPVNVTESEVSLVLEQLLSDLHDGIPDSSFSQNDTIAKSSMAKLSCKNGNSFDKRTRELG